ncbi:hypothetical protein HK102_008350, partial [Quaeritorhiza haematococci]
KKQVSCQVPPTLPPELVTHFLHLVDASWDPSISSYSEHTASLAQYTLVNRTWHKITTPLLWKTVRLDSPRPAFQFLRRLFLTDSSAAGSACVPRTNQLKNYWPGMWVDTLKFSCTDRQRIWRTLLRNLFLFPKLCRLTLKELPSPCEVAVLSDQDLPSLTHLALSTILADGEDYPTKSRGSWDYRDTRVAFSRLSSVKWKEPDDMPGDPVPGEDEYIGTCKVNCRAFLDTAHKNLRQIRFPDKTPTDVAAEFFARCSNALSVVRSWDPQFSWPNFEELAETCTGLRAFSIPEVGESDWDGFEYLMMLRGHQLVALELGDCDRKRYTDWGLLIRSVSEYCHALEYLDLCLYFMVRGTENAKFGKDQILNLVRKCGRTLRYLRLDICPYREWNTTGGDLHFIDDKLLRTIGDSCPNLRGLECFTSQKTKNMTTAEEDAIVELLDKCASLQTLDLDLYWPSSEIFDHISDARLGAKLRSLQGRIDRKVKKG